MTEEEWLNSRLPHELIVFLKRESSPKIPIRRLRLYLCGCWRDLLTNLQEREIPYHLVVAEKYADGHLSLDELNLVRESQKRLLSSQRTSRSSQQVLIDTMLATHKRLWDAALQVTSLVLQLRAGDYSDRFKPEVAEVWRGRRHAERPRFAQMLRDIFGNPFRPVAFDPRWRTSDSVGVARGIYEDRAFERMPILADALMDAGCDDEQVLSHCRGEGPHVRGCWVVDLVLGKE
jgi:hypothetical protein